VERGGGKGGGGGTSGAAAPGSRVQDAAKLILEMQKCVIYTEPCPRGLAQKASPCGSGLCDIFRPFIQPFLAVVRGLAAVSGWTGLGAVMERFAVGQTLPATSLALEPM